MNTIEQRRIEAGLTQVQLAERVGCAQTTIARIEKGAPARPVLLKAINDELDRILSATHNGGQICEAQPLYAQRRKAPESHAPDAASELAERLHLQAEIIKSQRQTIDAQAQTINALNTLITELKEAQP